MKTYCQMCGYANAYETIKPTTCGSCGEPILKPAPKSKPVTTKAAEVTPPRSAAGRRQWQPRIEESDHDFEVSDLRLTAPRAEITPVTKINSAKDAKAGMAAFDLDTSSTLETRSRGAVESTLNMSNLPGNLDGGVHGDDTAAAEPKSMEDMKRDMLTRMLKPNAR